MDNEKVLLIDGNSIAFRAFFALHQQLESFVSHEGLHTNAIYGFNTMLDKVLSDINPDKALVAFDAGKVTFRTKKFSEYKSGRKKTPSEFLEQIPFIKDLINAYGIKTYELKNYEADDIIGTIANKADLNGDKVTIVTGDRDLTQLVNDDITVAITKKGVSEIEYYTPKHIQNKYGIKPDQIVDLKGLMGDKSDNYPGVTGIGEKTAIKLLQKYSNIDNLYNSLNELKTSKMKEHLIADRDNAFLSKDLATIRKDAPIDIGLDELNYLGKDTNKLIKLYRKIDFKSFLSKLDTVNINSSTPKTSFIELTSKNLDLLDGLSDHVVFRIELDNTNYHLANIIGFAIGDKNHCFVSCNDELLFDKKIINILENELIEKSTFNLKEEYVALNKKGIHINGVSFDLLLVSYLLNTRNNSLDFGQIVKEYGYFDIKNDEDIYGKKDNYIVPKKKELLTHLAQKINVIFNLRDILLSKLNDNNQLSLYQNIELPLAIVLSKMEIRGIKVDAQLLIDMDKEFSLTLEQLSSEIYNLAGEKFNINSPKQLGNILFEKLQLPVIKKTKTGYSTSVDVLKKLSPQAPIIDQILNYRELKKLQSTYLEGLLKDIHSDGKVHTRYQQTLTQTGRLSSVDPNLQNIPVQTEQGRLIRKAFIPSTPDRKIVSFDYSQIELRVLAHITGDKALQNAFINDEDIHTATAKKIFKLSNDDVVTPLMRRQAKATNFGIVYGISDYGLSENLGISRKQAKEFINTYFEEYPEVYNYTLSIVYQAREKGFVETITHRRRYLTDINSKNFNLRSFAERTAMNTPIQGSAADIIKIAMINVEKAIKQENLKTRMLLQIHDELIFEAPNDELDKIENLVPKIMDSAVKLSVPLKVECAYGKSWFDAKK